MDTDKLRSEIQESKKYRHELVLRKFAFTTTLLGAGSLRKLMVSESSIDLDLTSLLLLVPLVAIAFDLYILAEDYRIKRAGEFISRNGPLDEVGWENFCKDRPNLAATVSFAFVTAVYLVGAAFLLWSRKSESESYDPVLLWCWVSAVLVAEVGLIAFSLTLRRRLSLG